MAIHGPHIGEYRVADGAGHIYEPVTIEQAQRLFLRLKYSGLVPAVHQWDEASQCYEFSEVLTDEMDSIPRSVPGRPVERTGDYQRITLEIEKSLLARIDAMIAQGEVESRRAFVEQAVNEFLRVFEISRNSPQKGLTS